MELDHSMRDGCVVVTLTGQINPFTAPRIQRVLLKDLAERPLGIICDLSGVESLDPVCATVFSTVASRPASDWPATTLLLCAARPPYLRDELFLAPTTTAPAAARLYLRDVLQYWRLALPDQDVIERAELLADELVTNAVVHARTPLRLRLELSGDLLHIGVYDASPRLLRLVPDDLDAEGGRGLRLVERLATAWGVHQRRDGGKVVWCTLPIWQRPAGLVTGP